MFLAPCSTTPAPRKRLELHHLAFRTRDLGALRRFYEEIFELRPVREQTGYSVWFQLGAAVLMLECAAPGEPSPDPDSQELFALRTDDSGRAAVKDRLAAARIALEAETDHTTYFRDPDGRRIAVSTYPLSS